jgi:hypothetical protein
MVELHRKQKSLYPSLYFSKTDIPVLDNLFTDIWGFPEFDCMPVNVIKVRI